MPHVSLKAPSTLFQYNLSCLPILACFNDKCLVACSRPTNCSDFHRWIGPPPHTCLDLLIERITHAGILEAYEEQIFRYPNFKKFREENAC